VAASARLAQYKIALLALIIRRKCRAKYTLGSGNNIEDDAIFLIGFAGWRCYIAPIRFFKMVCEGVLASEATFAALTNMAFALGMCQAMSFQVIRTYEALCTLRACERSLIIVRSQMIVEYRTSSKTLLAVLPTTCKSATTFVPYLDGAEVSLN
jgi:hypothetical protein